jgi:hypothetical protein
MNEDDFYTVDIDRYFKAAREGHCDELRNPVEKSLCEAPGPDSRLCKPSDPIERKECRIA